MKMSLRSNSSFLKSSIGPTILPGISGTHRTASKKTKSPVGYTDALTSFFLGRYYYFQLVYRASCLPSCQEAKATVARVCHLLRDVQQLRGAQE
eukprot:IDg7012t1